MAEQIIFTQNGNHSFDSTIHNVSVTINIAWNSFCNRYNIRIMKKNAKEIEGISQILEPFSDIYIDNLQLKEEGTLFFIWKNYKRKQNGAFDFTYHDLQGQCFLLLIKKEEQHELQKIFNNNVKLTRW